MKLQSRRNLGAGIAGIALTAGLAGCATPAVESAQAADDDPSTTPAETNSPAESASTADASSSSGYADGEYTASGSYTTPGGRESVDVTLSLVDGIVTAVTVNGSAERGDSQRYQSEFIANIASEVVGVAIDELDVSKVAGSSLTSSGFNEAVSQILDEAQA